MEEKIIRIYTHRGGPVACPPGNTIAAFKKTIELEADGLECDLRFTKDGVPIICHYNHLKQFLGEDSALSTLKVSELSWKEIRKLAPEVPHLNELMSFLRYNKTIAFIELKENTKEIVDVVIEGMKRFDVPFNRVVLLASYMPTPLDIKSSKDQLIYAKSIEPRIQTSVMALFPICLRLVAKKSQADSISFGWLDGVRFSRTIFMAFVKIVNLSRQIKRVQQMGVEVIGGTINQKEDIRWMLEQGVDSIFTDDLVAAQEVVTEFKKTQS